MNKMLFPQGGVPLSLDDLQFMQDSFADTIKQIGNAMGQRQDFILYGCNVMTTTDDETKTTSLKWTSGAVCLGGEIYPVEAGSIPVQDKGTLYWKVMRTEDTDVALKNGTQTKLHSTAKAVLTYTVMDADEKYGYASSKGTFADIIGGIPRLEQVADISTTQGRVYIYRYRFKGLTVYDFVGGIYHDNTSVTVSLPREFQGRMDQCFCALGKTSEEPAEYKMIYAYINNNLDMTFFTSDQTSSKRNLYFEHYIMSFN